MEMQIDCNLGRRYRLMEESRDLPVRGQVATNLGEAGGVGPCLGLAPPQRIQTPDYYGVSRQDRSVLSQATPLAT